MLAALRLEFNAFDPPGGQANLGREEVFEVCECGVEGNVDEEKGAPGGGDGKVGFVGFEVEVVGCGDWERRLRWERDWEDIVVFDFKRQR